MSKRRYYTLCERTPGQLYAPQFGDYSKAVVLQERRDMKDSGSFEKGTEYAIVETSGSQKAITEACDALNTSEIILKSIKEKEALVAKQGRTGPRNYGSRPVAKVGHATIVRNNRLLDREHPGTMADRKK